jgi:ABC-2 type transport system permease protein
MIATRPGPPEASPWLLHPLGLAWRLQRNVFLAWAFAMVVLGLAYGAMAQEMDDLVGSSEEMRDVLEQFGGAGVLEQVYLSATIAMAGLGVAAYTVQATLRLRNEEVAGHAESVLATAVSRTRWVGTHAGIAAVGTAALLAIEGGATGLAYGVTTSDPVGELGRYAWAGLLQAPAALLLGGLAVLLFGLVPAASRALAWTAFAACLVFGQLGELLGLPSGVLDLSPFTHLAAVPVEPVRWLPVVALAAWALALAAFGATAFRRRDLKTA